jgi:Flavodoxins
MKSFMSIILLLLISACIALPAHAAEGNVLVAYFSWSGNSRRIATQIHEKVGGDLVEIEMSRPYSRSYNTCLEESLRDLQADARPALKTRIADMSRYDVIFLGYPTWWATIPMPVATFLEAYDFSGKTIAPFNSHGGGRLGQTVPAIAKLCPNVTIKEALSISYGGGTTLGRDIDSWLQKIGMGK